MVEPSTSVISFFTDEQKAELRELVSLAGLDIRSEAFELLLQLLALGAAPGSLGTVFPTICNSKGSVARRTSMEGRVST